MNIQKIVLGATFAVLAVTVMAEDVVRLYGENEMKGEYDHPREGLEICKDTEGLGSLRLTGQADVFVKYLALEDGAQFSFEHGRLTLTWASEEPVSTVRDRRIFTNTFQGATVVSSNYYAYAFNPFADDATELVLNGGTFVAPAYSSSGTKSGGFAAAHDNTTHVVSGDGRIAVHSLFFRDTEGGTVRFCGPDLYLGAYGIEVGAGGGRLELGGGSRFGGFRDFSVYTGSVSAIDDATIDTDDCFDGSPRNFSFRVPVTNEVGATVTVIGAGEVTFYDRLRNYGGFVVLDSARLACHKDAVFGSLDLKENASLNVFRYVLVDDDGPVSLSGNASLSVGGLQLAKSQAAFTCGPLYLSDNASLVVTGALSATSVALSGRAHLAYTAGGSALVADATGWDDGDWQIEITIPPALEGGTYQIVRGHTFDAASLAAHVTLVTDDPDWSLAVVNGMAVFTKTASPVTDAVVWTGAGGDGLWSNGDNWSSIVKETERIAFNGSAWTTSRNNLELSVGGVDFSAGAIAHILTGQTLTLRRGVVDTNAIDPRYTVVESKSNFEQTFDLPVVFSPSGGMTGSTVFSDRAGRVTFAQGVTAEGFILPRGEIAFGGTSEVEKVIFRTTESTVPTTLRVLSGGTFTVRNQEYQPMSVASSTTGRLVVETGAVFTVERGMLGSRYGELKNVIDGRVRLGSAAFLATDGCNSYFTGSGRIDATGARSGSQDATSETFFNLGGKLTLCLHGDWYTASSCVKDGTVCENPASATRLHLMDGTTLCAGTDWSYGPQVGVALTNDAPSRAAKVTGTATIVTDDPDVANRAHTIAFVDPIRGTGKIVKTGAGALILHAGTDGSAFGGLEVRAGQVRIAADEEEITPLELSGELIVAKGAEVRPETDDTSRYNSWRPLVRATTITLADQRSTSGKYSFRIRPDGAKKVLETHLAGGFRIRVR